MMRYRLQRWDTGYSEVNRKEQLFKRNAPGEMLRRPALQAQDGISLHFGCHAIHRIPCLAIQDNNCRQHHQDPTHGERAVDGSCCGRPD
jgi:hypothetical protein